MKIIEIIFDLGVPLSSLRLVNAASSTFDIFYTIFKNLVGDPFYRARKAVAECILELAKILCKNFWFNSFSISNFSAA